MAGVVRDPALHSGSLTTRLSTLRVEPDPASEPHDSARCFAELKTSRENTNSQHLDSEGSQHLGSDSIPRSAHPPITRQLKPDPADTSPYTVASSLIRGSSRGLLGEYRANVRPQVTEDAESRHYQQVFPRNTVISHYMRRTSDGIPSGGDIRKFFRLITS